MMAPRQEGQEWTREALASAIRAFMDEHGMSGRLPTGTELQQAGRRDLLRAINTTGGMRAMAELLDLPFERKPLGYWTRERVLAEVLAFVAEHEITGRMPRRVELEEAGRADLRAAIDGEGGMQQIGLLLGLPVVSSHAVGAPKKAKLGQRMRRLRLTTSMIPPSRR